MTASIGWATLSIIPTVEGISGKVAGQIGAPLTAAGKKAGQDTGKAVADGIAGAKAAVEKAAGVLATAQNKAADAADKVGVAEAKLATLRSKNVADAGRLAAAEAAVAKAKRDSEVAANKAGTASAQLARAEESAAKAARTLGTESASAGRQVSDFGSNADNAESSLSRFGKLAAAGAGLAYLGGKALDAGKAFLDIGETFANVNKTLQFTTGATGENLDGMMESVKNIGKASPKSLDEISVVLAKLSQRTGLTGTDLETLTKQVIKTNAVMGTDTDINGLTQAFAAFGVQGKDTSAAMDELFKASRATGVGVNELAAQAVKGAPQFQQFGLSIGESAALMGSLDKAGINSDVVLTGLNKAMVAFAKDGRAPKEALNETITAIKDFSAAGNDAAAIEMASKLFGTKGAGQFVNAVKSGAVTVEGLTAAVDENQKGVLEAGGAIPTLSSAWAMFKNNVIIALEPVATRVFGIFIDGLTWFRTNGVTAIQAVVAGFQWLLADGPLSGVVDFFTMVKDGAMGLFNIFVNGDFTSAFAQAFNLDEDAPIVGQLFDIRDRAMAAFTEIEGGVRAFIAAFKDGGDEVTSSGFAGFLETLGVVSRNLYDTWNTTILPALQTLGTVAVEIGSVILPVLWGAFTTGIAVLTDIAVAIGSVVGFFINHKDVATVLAGIITALFLPAIVSMTAGLVAQGIAWAATTATMITYNAIGTALSVATKIWTAGQWLLNAALTANPIGLVIAALVALVGGIVLAYKNSETFRNIVTAAWDAIRSGWDAMYAIVSAGIAAFGAALGVIGAKADEMKTWVVQKFTDLVVFIVTLPGKISSAASGMWNGITAAFKGAINYIIKAWNALEFRNPGFEVGPIKWDGFTLGLPDIPMLAGGGIAGRRSDGSLFGPGSGTSDSILGVDKMGMPTALVSNEEGVVKKTAMDNGGAELVAALNAGWVPPVDYLRSMLPAFAEGGVVGSNELVEFAKGVEGKPYEWGGVNWGDCSGAISAIANFATGRDPFGSRFATMTEQSELAARGFASGLGGTGDLVVGWYNGGEYGGHTAATLPNGVNFEMGGGRGDGQYGGQAAGARDSMFTDHAHLKMVTAQSVQPNVEQIAPIVMPTDGSTSGGSVPESVSATSPGAAEATQSFSARDRITKMGSDIGGIWANAAVDILGVGEWLDLADRYTIKASDSGGAASAPGPAPAAGVPNEKNGVAGDPNVVPWITQAQDFLRGVGLFDTGGKLMPGQFGFNGLDEPEYVLKDAHWKAAEGNIAKVDELVGAGAVGGGPVINQVFNTTVADQAGFQRQTNRNRSLAMMQYGGRPDIGR